MAYPTLEQRIVLADEKLLNGKNSSPKEKSW